MAGRRCRKGDVIPGGTDVEVTIEDVVAAPFPSPSRASPCSTRTNRWSPSTRGGKARSRGPREDTGRSRTSRRLYPDTATVARIPRARSRTPARHRHVGRAAGCATPPPRGATSGRSSATGASASGTWRSSAGPSPVRERAAGDRSPTRVTASAGRSGTVAVGAPSPAGGPRSGDGHSLLDVEIETGRPPPDSRPPGGCRASGVGGPRLRTGGRPAAGTCFMPRPSKSPTHPPVIGCGSPARRHPTFLELLWDSPYSARRFAVEGVGAHRAVLVEGPT